MSLVVRWLNATAAVAAALGAVLVAAAAPAPEALPPGPGYHTTRAARIEATEAPAIDGDLADPAWAKATVLDQFRQQNPVAGDAPTERTVVRIMYDENYLYFGIYAYDQNPDAVVLRGMARDGNAFVADNVRVMLDPGATRRNGYAFQVTAAGGRRDTFLQNNQQQLVQWDTIWDAKVRLVADGWICEIAIPFRSLSYSPDQTEWGFEFSRMIRHKNESLRWSGYDAALDEVDITLAGRLTGIERVSQGLGLDVQVYATGRAEHDWQSNADTTITGTAGATAYYRITPALTGTLTFNPDFSDSPLDNRQVNTGRFSLFLAETRDFFLRDAGAFEFGGRNFGPNNGKPFVTRSIGLVRGRPVSIPYGGKLSGEFAGFDIGAVTAVIDDTASAPKQLLTAVRIARPVLTQSKMGFIVTHGDPTGASENTVAGFDFQYRTRVLDNQIFQSDFYYERSFSNAAPEDDSFGVAINLPNEPWGGEARFKEVGRDFHPSLGFVNREAIREYHARVERRDRFRNQFLQEMSFSGNSTFVTSLSDVIETRDINFNATFESRDNDNIMFSVNDNFELIPDTFELPDDILVAPGTYHWTNGSVRAMSSNGRSVQVTVNASCCWFYNGRRYDTNVNFNWRPGEMLELRLGHQANFIRMPNGSVDIHIIEFDTIVNFTPDMQLAMEGQYDNISEDFAFSARYRWEYSPGNELFVAFGQEAIIPGMTRFVAQTSVFTLRMGRTFQF